MQERRLTAIMFTDIVGYTALMGSDEDRAFEVLRKNREIHSKLIEQFNGTLIKEMGDGMLISFNLASDAVRCAIEIQKACKEQDIPLKIGIHEGEMVFEGNDVLGDGVNIASRLQEDTEEGCITISGSVYRDIKNKADIQTEFVGKKSFKNVDDKIEVFRVSCGDGVDENSNHKNQISNLPRRQAGKYQQSKSKKRNTVFAAIGFLAIIIASTLVWQFGGLNRTSPPSPEVSEDKDKSIAVRPFWNESTNLENEAFVIGMTEDIRNNLSKIAGLRVLSRGSVEKYKDSKYTNKEISDELNVSYVLEGTAQRMGNQVKIHVQLILGENEDHIWEETYIEDISDIKEVFNIQSKIAQSVANELKVFITDEEKARIEFIPTYKQKAYDFLIRGNYERSLYYKTGDKKHLKNSHNLLDRAIEIDPNYTKAYSSKASNYVPVANLDSMIYYVDRALKIDPDNPNANNRKARYYQGIGKLDLAIKYYLKSLKYNPNDVGSNLYLSQVYCVQKKDIQTGYPYLKKAMGLSVKNRDRFYDMGIILLDLGEYGKAEIYLRRYLSKTGSCRGLDAYNWFLLAEGNYNRALHFTDSICSLINCNDMCNEWFIRLYSYISEFEKAEQYIKKLEDKIGESNYSPEIGYVYHKLGRLEEAEEFFKDCIQNDDEYKSDLIKYSGGTNYRIAQIYAVQNKKREALQYIEVIDKLGLNIVWFDLMINDPMFENLRDDPEFKAIIKKVQDEKAAIRAQIREMEKRGELDF